MKLTKIPVEYKQTIDKFIELNAKLKGEMFKLKKLKHKIRVQQNEISKFMISYELKEIVIEECVINDKFKCKFHKLNTLGKQEEDSDDNTIQFKKSITYDKILVCNDISD